MPAAPAPAHPVHAHPAARSGGVERAIVARINGARRRYGLPRLRLVRPLSFVAGMHSLDLARRRGLSHTSSDGTTFARRVRRAVDAQVVGETIAEVSGGGARTVVRAWLRSPSHRAELLGARFRRVGVGRVRRGGSVVVTADFASGR